MKRRRLLGTSAILAVSMAGVIGLAQAKSLFDIYNRSVECNPSRTRSG
jgi:hypothetical protein